MTSARKIGDKAQDIALWRSVSQRSHQAIKSPPNVHNASERPFIVPLYDPQCSNLTPVYPHRRDSLAMPLLNLHPWEKLSEPLSPISSYFSSHARNRKSEMNVLPQAHSTPKSRLNLITSGQDHEHNHPAIPTCWMETPSNLDSYKKPLLDDSQDHSTRSIVAPSSHDRTLSWAHAIAAHLIMFSTQ